MKWHRSLGGLLAWSCLACGNAGGCSNPPNPDVVDVTDDSIDAADVGIDVPHYDVHLDTANVLAECGTTVDAGDPSFARVEALFQHRCSAGVQCHGAGGQQGFVLDPVVNSHLHNDLMAVSVEFPSLHRIEPGDPSRSYLWLKLSGEYELLPTDGCTFTLCGARMPMTPSPIAEGWNLCEAHVLYDWIRAGAPN